MITRAMAWSARHPWIVILCALLLVVSGERARRALSQDVIPDLSDPQIVLHAEWMGHPAVEVATAITNVLTGSLKDIPGARAVRGSSMAGMAFVAIVFDSAEATAAGREAILKRLRTTPAKLPPNVHVQVGPMASSTGWVFQYALVDSGQRHSPGTLRRYQDEVLRPFLANIPGVAEVAAVGGGIPQIVVDVKLDELRARGLAFTDVLTWIERALEWDGTMEPQFIAGQPLPKAGEAASEIRVADVADVRLIDEVPSGLADLGGKSSVVGGIVVAKRGADLPAVIERVRHALDRARKTVPEKVEIVTVYDRLPLIERVEKTLLTALGEEIAVVVLVIVVFLMHWRSALVPLMTLPVVLLLTFAGMWALGIPATIMSLGGIAIALGMAVDADVVALEACHRRLQNEGTLSKQDRRQRIIAAAASVAPAIVVSLLIAALTFLPVLAFSGETGRLLHPLALTKTLVILSAALVALTLAPALRDRLMGGRIVPEFDSPLNRGLVRLYRPFVHFALRRPALTLATAVLAVVSCVPIVSRLGGEFLPRVDEGDILFMPTTLAGVSRTDAAEQLRLQNQAIGEFGEVALVFGKVGRADTATDPAPFSMAETNIVLRPPEERPKLSRPRWYSDWAPQALRPLLGAVWPEHTARTTAELVESLDHGTSLPGWTNAWTAPARARMDMTSTGVHTPVGIRITAANPDRLDSLGATVRALISRVPGTRSATFESLGGETGPDFEIDAGALALHGVDGDRAKSTVDLVLKGGHVGEVSLDSLEGRRVPVHVRVRADESLRAAHDDINDVTVRSSKALNQPVPLALLGRSTVVSRPATVRTEAGQLVAHVYVDLNDGSDPLSYVEKAQGEIDHAITNKQLRLERGERLEWTGQYELLAAGQQRLKWIAPLVAACMLGLLFLQFRSVTQALIVLVSVPFALVGSFWTLFLLDYQLSAPVWVGLLSVVGLAMQTGVVMVVYIDEAFHRRVREGNLRTREDIVAAHAEGTVLRLRPKLMTITTMGASLLPLLWADGAGAEIMKRVAAPMVGGLATSAFLTLEVLPVLYTIWRHRQLKQAQSAGVPLETIVGTSPAWARR